MSLDLTGNVYVQVWDSEGNAADAERLASLTRCSTPRPDPRRVQTFSTVRFNGSPLPCSDLPMVVQPEGTTVGYLQLASSLGTVDRAQSALLVVLGGGGLLAVVIAGLVGWTTAGAALRPLDQVTETALQITRADDLSRRIPLIVARRRARSAG